MVDSVKTETAPTKKKRVLRKTLLTKSAPRKAKRHVITVKGTKGKCVVRKAKTSNEDQEVITISDSDDEVRA